MQIVRVSFTHSFDCFFSASPQFLARTIFTSKGVFANLPSTTRYVFILVLLIFVLPTVCLRWRRGDLHTLYTSKYLSSGFGSAQEQAASSARFVSPHNASQEIWAIKSKLGKTLKLACTKQVELLTQDQEHLHQAKTSNLPPKTATKKIQLSFQIYLCFLTLFLRAG